MAIKKYILILLLSIYMGQVFAQATSEAPNKNSVVRMLDWVSIFTMYSNVELSDKVDLKEYGEAANLMAAMDTNPELSERILMFKAATFVNVYPKGLTNTNEWIFQKLNEVSDAQYDALNAPYITLEVIFTPVNENTAYKVSVNLRGSSEITQNIQAAATQINIALNGKVFSKPRDAKEIVNTAIFGGLTQLQTLLGSAFVPNIAVLHDDDLYLNNNTIETWQRTGESITLEAVDKNGTPLTGTIAWTNAQGTGSRATYPVDVVGTNAVSVQAGANQMSLNVKVKEFEVDINDLLKKLLIELLTVSKKQAADTLAMLRQDSINNARAISVAIAELERGNFPMENIGATLTPLFSNPITLTDTSEFKDTTDRGKSLKELRKRKKLTSTIRRKVNVVAFADLVVDSPERINNLLEELLKNSGELLANLILNKDSKGQAEVARNIVVEYLNQNLERIADGHYADTEIIEPPLQVAPASVSPPTIIAGKFHYINPNMPLASDTSFVNELSRYLKNQQTPLYVFINYSQDVNTETYLLRTQSSRPKGLPDNARYLSFTVVNIPGSVKEQLFLGTEGEIKSYYQSNTSKEQIWGAVNETRDDIENSVTALYQTDGHYWTVYLVAMMIGIEDQISRSIAYEAEYPDGVVLDNTYSERYSWLKKEDQKNTHVLNGRYGPDVTKETVEMIKKTDKYNFKEIGRLVHRLGDSFAHRKLDGSNYLYGSDDDEVSYEHFLWDFDAPDLIQNRPGLYEEYVNVLADVLIEKFEQAKTINKIEMWNKTHELAMYATTNKVSLLGIINYEVAKLKKSETFIVHKNITYIPGAQEAHDTYVTNTIKYLTDRKVKFSTKLNDFGTVFTLID